MNEKAVLYARVSKEEQTTIDEQYAAMSALVDRQGWTVIDTFTDNQDYKATKSPKKGQMVNPSGERDDRPGLLAMLGAVKTGKPDVVLCWRDDRLVRHPRVAVAIIDALELGDAARKLNGGGGKIQIHDATGTGLDRDFLQVMAVFWKKENQRRAERVKLGKIDTLRRGRWPNEYNRLGYTSIKEAGERGRRIVLADAAEVQTVCDVFDWCIAGDSLIQIQAKLLARSAEQKGTQPRKHNWSIAIIHQIIRSEEYTGKLTWRFRDDGSEYTIDIPQIVTPERWRQAQEAIDRHKKLSSRNAKGVYMLQNLAHCGECGTLMGVRTTYYTYRTMADGSRKRYDLRLPIHQYLCSRVKNHQDEPHPRPYNHSGNWLDDKVWRKLVDFGIKRPGLVRKQIEQRQAELQADGDSADGEIARVRKKLTEIENERAFYQRQAARGKLTESEFDARMDETAHQSEHYTAELERLKILRDSAETVRAGLDYSEKLLTAMQSSLERIDMPADELRQLPKRRYFEIVKERQKIVRALVERVNINADGKIEILGVLDGSAAAEFELERPARR